MGSRCWRSHVLTWTAVMITGNLNAFSEYVTSICMTHSKTLSCSRDEILVVNSAHYGRMAPSVCIDNRRGTLGCSVNVLPYLDDDCSGQPNCSVVLMRNAGMGLREQPCSRGKKNYLRISKRCIHVQTASLECVQLGHAYALFSDNDVGFLSSWVAEQRGVGQSSCPWLIHTTSDKQINISLHDYGGQQVVAANYHEGCRKYVTISDDNGVDESQVTVCQGSQRMRHVFLSVGRKVKVVFHDQRLYGSKGHFLLEYRAIKSDGRIYQETDSRIKETFKITVLSVLGMTVFLGFFSIMLAYVYVKLVKDPTDKTTTCDVTYDATTSGDPLSHQTGYQRIPSPCPSSRQTSPRQDTPKYCSYMWESFIEDDPINNHESEQPNTKKPTPQQNPRGSRSKQKKQNKAKDTSAIKKDSSGFSNPEIILIVDDDEFESQKSPPAESRPRRSRSRKRDGTRCRDTNL